MNNQEAIWESGIKAEIDFWEDWIINKGLFWPEEYAERINPETPIQEHISRYIDVHKQLVYILDVGSGPISFLGKKNESSSTDFKLTCVDPLGKEYLKLLKKYGIIPHAPLFTVRSEELSLHLPENYFDIVYMRNALDHSLDPKTAIYEMLKVAVEGGVILLEHLYNEAETQCYANFHQWNICIEHDDFIIWNRSTKINMTTELNNIARVTCFDNGKFNFIEIKK